MKTPLLQRTLIGAALGFGALAWAGASSAATIDWADFNDWTQGALSMTGFTNGQPAPGDLTGDATFTGGDFNNSPLATVPLGNTLTLDDAAWTFTNNTIPVVQIRNSTQTLITTLTLDFTNIGGLPAGGSIGVIDLEDPATTVQIVGYDAADSVVAVTWTPRFYQTAGVNSPDPTWTAATNTLNGNIPIGTAPQQLNNFVFLVSDVALARVDLVINQTATDGVAYAVSRQTVPVPVPATLLLLGSGLAGLGLRRRTGAKTRG